MMDIAKDPRRFIAAITGGVVTGPFAVLGTALRWLFVFYRQLVQHRAFLRAAGMAYISLIAIVPLLMLVFGVLGATGLLVPNRAAIEELLFRTFLGDIPEIRDFLFPALLDIDLPALGIVGVVGLLVATGRLYLNVETAYNDVYGTPVSRNFWQRVLNFYFVLTAVPVAIGVIAVGTQGLWALPTVSRVASPLVTFVMLLSALKLFPCRPVTWPAAISGALASAVLLEGGVRLFPLYVRVFASDDPLRIVYGSLGLIPVFLLWLYLLWVFVLLGVVVAYTTQNFRSLEAIEFELHETETRFVQAPSVGMALEVLVLVGTNFEAGRGPLGVDALTAAVECPPRELHQVLKVHEAGGFVIEVETGWILARPPEHIALEAVFNAWRTHAWIRHGASDVVGDAVHKVLVDRFQGTLADAMKWWSPGSAAPSPSP